MTSRFEKIILIAVIGVCSNLMCISTLSNELPSAATLGLHGKHDTNRITTPKQTKFGTRVLSSLDKLALLNHNEKMNAMDVSHSLDGDYRKNVVAAVNQNYLLQHPRILPPPPPPPPSLYHNKNFNIISTNQIGNNIYDDDIDDDDDDDDESDDADIDESTDNDDDNILQHLMDEIKLDREIALKSSGLLKLLLDIPSGPLPVIYIEETDIPQIPYYGLEKRGGRYNQRYPWKRQNSLYRRESIHPETRFHCIPSREEVFRLLIGLHENRSGNQPKTVRFCNRRRPARSILTSIRFMG